MAAFFGEADVDGFLSRVSLPQYRNWQRYAVQHSVNLDRVEMLLASLLCLVANYMRGKNGKILRIEDVLPGRFKRYADGDPRNYPPPEEVHRKVAAWAASLKAYYGCHRTTDSRGQRADG